MTSVLIALLIAHAAFNVLVWPAFLRRVVKDPRSRDAAGRATRFLLVHVVLVGLALALAAASIVVVVVALAQG